MLIDFQQFQRLMTKAINCAFSLKLQVLTPAGRHVTVSDSFLLIIVASKLIKISLRHKKQLNDAALLELRISKCCHRL